MDKTIDGENIYSSVKYGLVSRLIFIHIILDIKIHLQNASVPNVGQLNLEFILEINVGDHAWKV